VEEEKSQFQEHVKEWRNEKILCAVRGVNCYQGGLHFMLLPFAFILPFILVPIALLIWLVSLLLLRASWQPRPEIW